MSLRRPDRIRQEELLDSGAGSPEEIAASLRDLRRINRYLGGHRVSLIPIRELVRSLSLKQFSLLDVATGGADLPVAAARWAQRIALPCRVVGLDISSRHLAFARESIQQFPGIRLVRGDIDHLPFAPSSFDFVNTSLFLHHVADAEVAPFLKTLTSLARVAVIINDLQRHWVPYFFLKLTQPVFARSRITQFDGFASLRQGFTPGEMRALAENTGIANISVTRRFPYRLAMVIPK
ncbi:MAG: methyltransferase domain-containing protein [Acidobacteriia bacterium]|nr:methyltransferase domain-containing protein [Terriglobia bacterium]